MGFDFRFPFQKFSDHLIGRYIFKKYEAEFGKDSKNLKTAKRFFSRRRKLGKFLDHAWNRGVVEALSIQAPEHLRGIEFVEVAPYLANSYAAKEAFVESLIWRKPTAFTRTLTNTLDYINEKITGRSFGDRSLLNALLAVASVPNHPLNSNFLHNHLDRLSMASRDAWWSIYLHHEYGERTSVDRLVEWAWSDAEKSHVNDDAVRLYSVALAWFLATPNRFLRDKSTKALVALVTDRLNVVLALLEQFQNVNDPYISQRLYAVAYGCAIRTTNDRAGLKRLATWVYRQLFQHNDPPVDILLRDYARGTIDFALHVGVKLRVSRKKVTPPFNSKWPKRLPTEKVLRQKFYPEEFFQEKSQERGYLSIWSSVMYEPPRNSRSLHSLRGWSDEQVYEIFT